jgi:DNA-binding protein HU-beta
MTKAEIVKEISHATGIEAVTVSAVVESFMEQVRTAQIGGENVYLRGFGTFLLKHRAEKTARNITKNTTITVPAHNIPAFKPSPEFLEKVK